MTMLEKMRSIFSVFSRARHSGMTEQELLDFFSGGIDTSSSISVSEETALRLSTVYACVTLIAETIASLPLILYRRSPDGSKTRATDHSLYDLVRARPNPEMTAFSWLESSNGHLLLWGNAYAVIERDRLDNVIWIWPVPPDKVRPKRYRGRIVYDIAGEKRPRQAYEMLHVPGFGYNGLVGQSVIGFCREAIGLGLAAEEFGSRFFGSGANPGLTVKHPGKLSNEAHTRLKNSLAKAYSGLGKSHRLLILEEGMDAERISIPPEDAQFIELRKFQRSEICGMFKVPPHMIADLEKSSSWGTGIEQQEIGFVTHTLRHWLVRWEQTMNVALLSERERKSGYFFEFLVDGLLRGDIKSRYDAYATGRQWGWLSVNDIRRLENMDPVDGGDQYLSPLNMVPAEQVGSPPDGNRVLDHHQHCGCGISSTRTHEQRTSVDKLDDDTDPDAGDLLAVGRSHAGDVAKAFQSLVDEESAGLTDVITGDISGVDDIRRAIDGFYADMPATVKRKLQFAMFAYQNDISRDALSMVGKKRTGEKLRKSLRLFKDEYLASLGTRYTGDSLSQLSGIIDAMDADQIISAIRDKLDDWSSSKAQRYADEELIRAGNAMARKSWEAAGVRKLKWVTRGGKVCPFCKTIHGKIVGIDSPFLDDGEALYSSDGKNWMAMTGKKMHPPIHRGCVCIIVPVVTIRSYQQTGDIAGFVSTTSLLPDDLQAFLTPYSESDYRAIRARLYMSGSGSGYGITPFGELISLFSLPGYKEGAIAIASAIANGADHLYCFDTGLVEMYQEHGFKVAGRVAFNDEYAPEKWNFERFGRPDVVHMTLDTDDNSERSMNTRSGHREGNVWVDDDGTVRTIMEQAYITGEPVDDANANHGTEEAQDIISDYLEDFE